MTDRLIQISYSKKNTVYTCVHTNETRNIHADVLQYNINIIIIR